MCVAAGDAPTSRDTVHWGQGPTSGAAPAAYLGTGAPQGLLGTSVRPQLGPSWR